MKPTIFVSFICITLIATCFASPVAKPDPSWWFPVPIPSPPAASPGIVVQGANGGINYGGGSFVPPPPPTIIAPNPYNVVVTPGDASGNGGSITISG